MLWFCLLVFFKSSLNDMFIDFIYLFTYLFKPGGAGQIPYDLTFNWNIINRRKKETKYNERH